MSITAPKTEAETAIARQFADVAHLLPGGGWVASSRARSMQAFEVSGLPHRRIEEWKYTDLRTGLKTAFPPAQCSPLKLDEKVLAAALGPELAGLATIRFVLVNGRLVSRGVPPGHEPGTGYHADPLAAMMGSDGHAWMPSCFAIDDEAGADPVMALNGAFVTDGIVVRTDEGARVGLPIHIVSIVDADAPKSVATRNLIKVGKGGHAVIIESHIALGPAPVQATAVTQISVEAGGTAHHIQHLAAGAGSAHLGRWDVELAEGATYRGFQLTAGAGLARNETHVSFLGPNAKFDLSGLMLGRGQDHIDTTLMIDHSTTGCESRELFKAVLDERARAVFQGKVVVEAEAQKTDGKQMAQALMLSETAEFDAKPELEIYADDVVCGHGATVAEIDSAMQFYLQSRGIPADEARAMLVESFAAEAVEKIDNEDIRQAFSAIALDWLRRA